MLIDNPEIFDGFMNSPNVPEKVKQKIKRVFKQGKEIDIMKDFIIKHIFNPEKATDNFIGLLKIILNEDDIVFSRLLSPIIDRKNFNGKTTINDLKAEVLIAGEPVTVICEFQKKQNKGFHTRMLSYISTQLLDQLPKGSSYSKKVNKIILLAFVLKSDENFRKYNSHKLYCTTKMTTASRQEIMVKDSPFLIKYVLLDIFKEQVYNKNISKKQMQVEERLLAILSTNKVSEMEELAKDNKFLEGVVKMAKDIAELNLYEYVRDLWDEYDRLLEEERRKETDELCKKNKIVSAELRLLKTELTKGKAELTKGKAELTKGKAELAKGKAELTKGKAKLTKRKAELTKRKAELIKEEEKLEEERMELAKILLQVNFSIEEVSKRTKISLEKVKELYKSIMN